MKVVCDTLWLPKKGNSPEEYEDAAAPDQHLETDCDDFVCAIADGATETSFSRLWARLLVSGYREGKQVAESQKLWEDRVSQKSLTWYAEQKAESGAYAALVGLKISKNGRWEAEAIGDSCLMHVRDKSIMQTFPLTRSDQFNSNPFLLSSKADSQELNENLMKRSGDWKVGDAFYLMTDAIACWTLKRQEQSKDGLDIVSKLASQKDLESFSETQRTTLELDGRPLMRNDDVTLMRITIG